MALGQALAVKVADGRPAVAVATGVRVAVTPGTPVAEGRVMVGTGARVPVTGDAVGVLAGVATGVAVGVGTGTR